MNPTLRREFNETVLDAKKKIALKEYSDAFRLLERAHIMGQRYVVPHTVTHFFMLKIGLLQFNLKEIFGQLIRLPLGILGSAIGKIPVGNTGGSNVSVFKTMDIPEDLQDLLKAKRP
tara:strand:- start:4667 stop:5017 length:351 start_codon:yes stop_codon:yes gene_type:complete